jgi:hypothetical protein
VLPMQVHMEPIRHPLPGSTPTQPVRKMPQAMHLWSAATDKTQITTDPSEG